MRKLLLTLFLLPSLAWANSAYEAYVIDQLNPALFWYMNEASGDLANSGSGGSDYDLGVVNAPSYSQAGVNAIRGNSLLWVAANSDYAEVNKNDTGSGPGDFGGDRTWNCWIKNTGTATGIIMSAADSQAGGQANRNAWLGVVNSSGNKVFFTIWQNIGTDAYIQTNTATAMTAGVWYMVTATWVTSGTTLKVYRNDAEDGTNSTTTGTIANATTWFATGRSEGDGATYFDGNTQDCFISVGAMSAEAVEVIYNFGNNPAASLTWPFLTKKPMLPEFRNDGYFEKFVSRGYNTGLFATKTRVPQYLNVGYVPFSVLPPGNVR